jgi:hypothetical protein
MVGYNRSGTKRKLRLKRAKREAERLAAKAAVAAKAPPTDSGPKTKTPPAVAAKTPGQKKP